MSSCSRECDPLAATRLRAAWIGAGITIAAALLLAAFLLFVDDSLSKAIAMTMTPGILVLGTQWIYLRGRSWRVKALMIGGPLLVLFLIGLAAGLAVDG